MSSPPITMAEYARSRKARGLTGGTKAGVLKAVRTGRISTVNGMIDPTAADRQWDERTNRKQQRPSAVVNKPAQPERKVVALNGPKPETLAEAQTRKEIALANLREKEDRERDGQLVEAAMVESRWAEIGVKFRDAVMGLRSSVCNRLPAEWRREVAAVLDDEARHVLTALSDEIRSAPQAA